MNLAFLALPLIDVPMQSGGGSAILPALIGAVLAAVLAFVIYRFRDRLMNLLGLIRERAGRVETRAQRGHEARYRDSVVDQANRWHIGGHLVALEKIAVEPQFLLMPRPYDPRSEIALAGEEVEGPYGIVPLVQDYPQVAGVYGLPGTDISHVLKEVPGLALLGTPGSGRSVALALIAIVAARQSREDEAGGLAGELRIPVLFHLADVDLSLELEPSEVDPADLLTAAVLKRMTGGGARSAPGVVPPAMAAGLCLVLVDGWDELPATQRNRTLAWLKALIRTYPENKYVVACGARGYAPLVEIGLTPVYLRPWGDSDFEELASRWAEVWPEVESARRRGAKPPTADTIRQVAQGNLSHTPLDVTLKAWSTYSGDEKATGRRGWYDSYLDQMLPLAEGRESLQRLAAEAVTGREQDDSGMLGRPEDEVRAFVDAALAKAGRLAMDTQGFLHEVTADRPLLVERVGGRYSFVHPLIEGYLAAEVLAASSRIDDLRGENGRLATVLPFLTNAEDISRWATERMSAEPELLYDHVLSVAAWTADAGADATWRQEVLRRLAQALLSPSQYPVVRRRALAALVASRDPRVAMIFRQGVQAENPLARTLSVLGLGAFRNPDMLDDIASALGDPDVSVQVAAALAIGTTPGEAAREMMVHLLFEGNETVRRAVAESLAKDPNLGHQLLREAIDEEDVMVRRAAIYGLARIGESWVLEILADRQIKDDQWFVRDAASEALERFETGRARPSPLPYPLPDELGWLVEWAEERGEAVPSGKQAVELLAKALQEGDIETRYAAADALGKLGGLDAVRPLYAALRDSSSLVRENVYDSLAEISQAEDSPLPAVL